MATPYNTGKVKIGSAYVPPPRRELSDTEIKLQRALLRQPPRQPLLERIFGRA